MSQQDGDEYERQREHQIHQSALADMGKESKAPETLKYVSEPESIDSPADALEWINSKAASTTNLSEEDTHSKEWVLEYFQLMARMERPPHYGLSGHRRAYAYGDIDEFRRPLKPGDVLQFEGYSELGKETAKRSKEGWGVETTTRDTKESIMRKDEGGGRGGILGRFG